MGYSLCRGNATRRVGTSDRFHSRLSCANTVHCHSRGDIMKTHTDRSAKLVVVIDDDPLVIEATAGLLNSWGCQVVTADSYVAALEKLTGIERRPDLIVCDYRLSEENNGIDVIQGLRSAYEIPALLISGDPVGASDREKPGGNYCLLQKPLDPSRFRAALVGVSVLPA